MYVYREFEAELVYDYKIKKEESIRVSLGFMKIKYLTVIVLW